MAEQTKDECVQNAKLAEQAERYVTIYHATFALVYLHVRDNNNNQTDGFLPFRPSKQKNAQIFIFSLESSPSMYLLTKGIA